MKLKSCPKMQEVIGQLAQRHEVDLTQAGAQFRLDMPGFDRLFGKNIRSSYVLIAHYFDQDGDLIPDPEILFFVGRQDLGWIPIEITQVIGGWRKYVEVFADGTQFIIHNQRLQADLAEFGEIWARNIRDQGWLKEGVKFAPDDKPKQNPQPPGWPEPTVDHPDLETLEEWMRDGGCEATDGCWVEPDGVCQHGYPSWLLWLGLI